MDEIPPRTLQRWARCAAFDPEEEAFEEAAQGHVLLPVRHRRPTWVFALSSAILIAALLSLCLALHALPLSSRRHPPAAGASSRQDIALWSPFNWLSGAIGAGGHDGYARAENSDGTDAEPPSCKSPVPLVKGPHPSVSISSSSEYAAYDSAEHSRMGSHGWAAAASDKHPWLEWDFAPHVVTVLKVQTRGRPYNEGQVVTKYSLEYTEDGVVWTTYPVELNGTHADAWDVLHDNQMTPPFNARTVRLHLLEWDGASAAIVELIGCMRPGPNVTVTVLPPSTPATTLPTPTPSTPATTLPTTTPSTPATTLPLPTTTDENGCDPDGWKWTFHPFRKTYSFERCTPGSSPGLQRQSSD
jgi:hypothetical protein